VEGSGQAQAQIASKASASLPVDSKSGAHLECPSQMGTFDWSGAERVEWSEWSGPSGAEWSGVEWSGVEWRGAGNPFSGISETCTGSRLSTCNIACVLYIQRRTAVLAMSSLTWDIGNACRFFGPPRGKYASSPTPPRDACWRDARARSRYGPVFRLCIVQLPPRPEKLRRDRLLEENDGRMQRLHCLKL
jgi:hypothetical protein